MYLKKGILISFFIITVSASNLYMPMIWLYVFLLDFLIPFLCDPGLQCRLVATGRVPAGRGWSSRVCVCVGEGGEREWIMTSYSGIWPTAASCVLND